MNGQSKHAGIRGPGDQDAALWRRDRPEQPFDTICARLDAEDHPGQPSIRPDRMIVPAFSAQVLSEPELMLRQAFGIAEKRGRKCWSTYSRTSPLGFANALGLGPTPLEREAILQSWLMRAAL